MNHWNKDWPCWNQKSKKNKPKAMHLFRLNRLKLLVLSLLIFSMQHSYTQNVRISSYSLNSSGHDLKNAVMNVRGSISQPLIGLVKAGTVSNHQGFWYVYSSTLNTTTPLQPVSVPDPRLVIYPNPFYELLNLDISLTAQSHCTIVDMNGKVLHSYILTPGKSAINLGNLASGTYLIRVRNKHSLYSRLILKL
jgi:hypothetical protein